MLTRDTAFKQLVLEAVDHNERMRLVVGLIQRVCQHPHHMHHAVQLISLHCICDSAEFSSAWAKPHETYFSIPVQTLDSVQGRAKQSGDDSQQQLTIPPRLQLLPPSPFKGGYHLVDTCRRHDKISHALLCML